MTSLVVRRQTKRGGITKCGGGGGGGGEPCRLGLKLEC